MKTREISSVGRDSKRDNGGGVWRVGGVGVRLEEGRLCGRGDAGVPEGV